ncbi:MAG TPA: VWA domain-containing protein [Terriglobia bacterium]|nr:VWA domain-containing protein [Terriglobia bacterium]
MSSRRAPGNGPNVKLILISVAALITALSPALAQDGVDGSAPVITRPRREPPPETNLPKTAKIRVESTLVTAPVTVLDSSGDFVSNLDEKDFEITDNGAPQRIVRFDTTLAPIALVVVVETSDRVSALLDQIRPLGTVFSGLMLGPKGEAAVLTYADQVNLAQDFSSDSGDLARALGGVKAWGDKARLNDALSQAISLLEKEPDTDRRVIVAFSDGFDKGSETEKAEVIRRAVNAGVTIYGLGFSPAEALLKKKPDDAPLGPLDNNVTRPGPPGEANTPTIQAQVYDTPIQSVPILTAAGETIKSELASSLLEAYAGYTGGVYYSHWKKNALQNQLNRISSEVRSQYEIAYVPDTLGQPGFHRLEVRVNSPGLKVRTRAGYFNGGKNP